MEDERQLEGSEPVFRGTTSATAPHGDSENSTITEIITPAPTAGPRRETEALGLSCFQRRPQWHSDCIDDPPRS